MHATVLRYVREIGRSGSIRRAALRLNVASTAVNRQLLALEAQLGVRLFDRLPQGVRPTPAGALLLRHVGDTLGSYERLLAELDGLRGLRSGHVRIVALDSLLVDFLPRVLARFATNHGAVSYSVQTAAPTAVFQEIVAGEAELGLTFVAPASPAVKLVAAVSTPIGLLTAHNDPLRRVQPVTFAALAGRPVLLQHETLPAEIDPDFAAFCAGASRRLLSNSLAMLGRSVQAGMGVAFFTRMGFRREIAEGQLQWLRLESPKLNALKLGLYAPARRTLLPAASALLDTLKTSLPELERAK